MSIIVFCVSLAAARFFYPHASVPIDGFLVVFVGIGIATAIYGIQVLRGKTGKLTILQAGVTDERH